MTPYDAIYAKLKDASYRTYRQVRAEYAEKYHSSRNYEKPDTLDINEVNKRKSAFNSEWALVLQRLNKVYGYVRPIQSEEEKKAQAEKIKADRRALKPKVKKWYEE